MAIFKRRIAGLLLAVLILCLCSPLTVLAAGPARTTVRLQCGSAPRGGVAEAQILLEHSENIGAAELVLRYDPDLTFVSADPGPNGLTQIHADEEAHTLKLVMASTEPVPGDCLLGTVRFRISPEARGELPLTFLSCELTTIEVESVPAVSTDGGFRVMGVSLEIGTLEAAPGTRVEIPVLLGGDPCAAGISFDIRYDPSGLRDLQVLPGLIRPEQLNTATPGRIALAWNQTENMKETGVLLTLSFLVPDATGVSYPLTFAEAAVSDQNGFLQNVSTGNGAVTVAAPILQPALSASQATTFDGEPVRVQVKLDPARLISGVSFALDYPAACCELTAVDALPGVTVNRSVPGSIRVSMAGATPGSGEKVLLELTFRTGEATARCALTFRDVECAGTDGNLLEGVRISDGSIRSLPRVEAPPQDCSTGVQISVRQLRQGTCIAAVYDGLGRMLTSGVAALADTMDTADTVTVSYSGFDPAAGTELRLFLLDDSFAPQRAVLSCRLDSGAIVP